MLMVCDQCFICTFHYELFFVDNLPSHSCDVRILHVLQSTVCTCLWGTIYHSVLICNDIYIVLECM